MSEKLRGGGEWTALRELAAKWEDYVKGMEAGMPKLSEGSQEIASYQVLMAKRFIADLEALASPVQPAVTFEGVHDGPLIQNEDGPVGEQAFFRPRLHGMKENYRVHKVPKKSRKSKPKKSRKSKLGRGEYTSTVGRED